MGNAAAESAARHYGLTGRIGKDTNGACTYMRDEFTAVLERDGDRRIAYCPEIPGANGQSVTKEEARRSVEQAIRLG